MSRLPGITEATVVRLGAVRRLGTSYSNRIVGIEAGTHIPQLAVVRAITGLIDADLGNDRGISRLDSRPLLEALHERRIF